MADVPNALAKSTDWAGEFLMPTLGTDNYAQRCERVRQRKAKLRRLGIVEGSSKWNKLLYRR